MLAKGKLLTTYETGTQVQGPMTVQIPVGQALHHEYAEVQSPGSEIMSIPYSEQSAVSPLPQWDFLGPRHSDVGYSRKPPDDPPDEKNSGVRLRAICYHFQHFLE
jgi:hypothetical protein